jgi:outer membrane receptor for Fe3+-dicitrate
MSNPYVHWKWVEEDKLFLVTVTQVDGTKDEHKLPLRSREDAILLMRTINTIIRLTGNYYTQQYSNQRRSVSRSTRKSSSSEIDLVDIAVGTVAGTVVGSLLGF